MERETNFFLVNNIYCFVDKVCKKKKKTTQKKRKKQETSPKAAPTVVKLLV